MSNTNGQGLAVGRQKLLGHLAALSFALLIAGSFSVGHLAVPHLAPAALNSVRFGLGVAVMTGAYIALYKRLPVFPKAAWRFAVLGALMAVYFVLMFVALTITTPVATGAVFTLIPLMSAGFGFIILRQNVRLLVLFSLVIAGCGALWVIFKGDMQALLGFRIGKGEAIFFFGCAAHAAVATLNKKFNRGEQGVYFTLCTLTATGLWITLAGAQDIVSTDWTALPSIVWIAVFYLAIFTTAGTLFLVQFASMRLPASKVLSYGYLTPSAIIVIEGMLGHGWASGSVLIGAGVTALALVVMAFAPDI